MVSAWRRSVLGAGLLAVLVLPGTAAWPAEFYKVTPIYSTGQTGLSGSPRINDAGQVVGFGAPMVWSKAKGLQSVAGAQLAADGSFADINASGEVVGTLSRWSGGAHAWNLATGGDTDLNALVAAQRPLLDTQTWANGVNDAGVVVGQYNDSAAHRIYGFIVSPQGAVTALTNCFNLTRINRNKLAIAKQSTVTIGAVIDGNTGTATALPTLGGNCTAPCDLNNSGQVVGFSYNAGNAAWRPFLWDAHSGAMKDLGDLGGQMGDANRYNGTASGINEGGFIVGGSHAADGASHAFVTDAKNGMDDLNRMISPESSWVLENAVTINNEGAIVCAATNKTTKDHAWVLLELSGPFNPWPEYPPPLFP